MVKMVCISTSFTNHTRADSQMDAANLHQDEQWNSLISEALH